MHRILFLDAETYYADDYTLKKQTPAEYILDPRFEFIGCAAAFDNEPARWIDGPDFPAFLATVDPAHTTTVTFNALFDNCIFAWRYGFIPRRMLCAMRMAVALRGHVLQGYSLASVAKLLGVGVKGTAIASAKGLHRADIIRNASFYREYQEYGCNDVELCRSIFDTLLPEFPAHERRTMDQVLRCAVAPRWHVDRGMLTAHLKDLEINKANLLAEAGITDPKVLRSGPKFEELLKSRGVEVEYKPSQTDKTRMIPCFAKTDAFMEALQNDEDPEIQALACARLGARSTIEQSRGERLLAISGLDWNCYRPGNLPLLPIPYRYSAAHTHRLGGEWKINMQNLPASRGKMKSKLRHSLVAPPGYKAGVIDKAQVECRLNAWFCGQTDLLDLFAKKADPYSVLASLIFGIPVDKTTMDGIARFIGKSGELGLGFRCGAKKFYNMVLRQARILGVDMRALMAVWKMSTAEKAVAAYRYSHKPIQTMWYTLDNVIRTAWIGIGLPRQIGPVTIGNEGGHGYIEGPLGLRMWYGNPRMDDDGEFWYTYQGEPHKMHGGVMLENLIQFIARINLMCDALRIADRGFLFCWQTHDELGWLEPEDKIEECMRVAAEEMRRPPAWAPDIPLDVDVHIGNSYGECK